MKKLIASSLMLLSALTYAASNTTAGIKPNLTTIQGQVLAGDRTDVLLLDTFAHCQTLRPRLSTT